MTRIISTVTKAAEYKQDIKKKKDVNLNKYINKQTAVNVSIVNITYTLTRKGNKQKQHNS